jgi:hypothetical protein
MSGSKPGPQTKYHARINLDLPPALRDAARERAVRELIPLSAYVRQALLEALRRDGIEFDVRAASNPNT